MKKVLLLSLLVLMAGCIQGSTESAISHVAGQVMLQIVPATDVHGSDIEGIPRPDGFVRSSYESEEGYTSVTYRARGDRFDYAYQLYKGDMSGWNLDGESSEAGITVQLPGGVSGGVEKSTSLDYSKDNEYVTVSISLVSVGNDKFTEVSIAYSTYEETSQNENPFKPISASPYVNDIAQYSGAVLYDQSYTMIGGVKTYVDRYYVNSTQSMQELFEYYSNLNPDGWTKGAENLESNQATILFTNGQGTISIMVEPSTYGGFTVEVTKMVQ